VRRLASGFFNSPKSNQPLSLGRGLSSAFATLRPPQPLDQGTVPTVTSLVPFCSRRDSTNDSAVLPLSDPADISQARDLIIHDAISGDTEARFPRVKIVAGRDGINRDYCDPHLPEWSWHAEEFFFFMGGVIPEEAQSPAQLESYFNSPGAATSLTLAIFPYTVVRELGPIPLLLSLIASSKHVEF